MRYVSPKRKVIDRELIRNREELRTQLGNRCEVCGCYCNLEFHHIKKRSHGIDHSKKNLLGCCGICHMRADHPNSEMTINGVKYPPFTIEQQRELVTKRTLL